MEPLSQPPSDALALLSITSLPGSLDTENNSSTEQLRREIERLQAWESWRVSTDWNILCSNPTSAEEGRSCSGTVDAFLENEMGGAAAHFFEMDSSDGVRTEWGALSKRKDLDFSERVWNFFQRASILTERNIAASNSMSRSLDATSESDLVDGLTAIVDALETSKLRPLVTKGNPTSFARVVRDIVKLSLLTTSADVEEQRKSISDTFDYWLESPMEIMVELGLWKLGRDYRFLLTGDDGVSGALLVRYSIFFF